MSEENLSIETGEILGDETQISLAELCRACGISAEQLIALVDQGIVEPQGREPAQWRFYSFSLRRVRCALHLERDLGVNLAGAALAIDLLEELERLRSRLRIYEE